MRHEIILFRFTSPVHFGDAAEGGDLGEILSYCRADTFSVHFAEKLRIFHRNCWSV